MVCYFKSLNTTQTIPLWAMVQHLYGKKIAWFRLHVQRCRRRDRCTSRVLVSRNLRSFSWWESYSIFVRQRRSLGEELGKAERTYSNPRGLSEQSTNQVAIDNRTADPWKIHRLWASGLDSKCIVRQLEFKIHHSFQEKISRAQWAITFYYPFYFCVACGCVLFFLSVNNFEIAWYLSEETRYDWICRTFCLEINLYDIFFWRSIALADIRRVTDERSCGFSGPMMSSPIAE